MSDVNLIPAHRLVKKRWNRRLRIWLVICGTYFLLLSTGLLATHLLCNSEDNSVEGERRSTEQSIQRYNTEVSELHGKLAEAARELEVSQAISTQPDWSKLLVLLGSELGEEVVLRQCGLVTTDAEAADITSNLSTWLSSSPLETLLATRRYRLKIVGLGRNQGSVSQFVLGLEQTEMFDSVRLINSNRQAFLDGQAIAFSLECWI